MSAAEWAPKRWLRILLPLVIIASWLVAGGLGGPTFGKLSSVSSNDQASFLPADAESTAAGKWQEKFRESEAIPAVVVLEAEGTIDDAELAELAPLAEQLQQVDGVQTPQEGQSSVAGPIPSEDGAAVQYLVPISDTENVDVVVQELRNVLTNAVPAGLSSYVTGPAGLSADLVSAFAGIDGILLLVALGAVSLILLAVYRSIVLPLLVLLTSVFALCASILVVYAFAGWGWISLSGQSQGILSILVIGAATDYSLLLVARYREALGTFESKWAAIRAAMKGAFSPIVASGMTVALALLCLLFSELDSNRSLGPIAAIGIVFSLFSALTFLPAVLVAFGRAAFWPFRPRVGSSEHRRQHVLEEKPEPAGLEGASGIWKRIGLLVARRPRATWTGSLLVLLIAGAGVLQLQASGVSSTDLLLAESNAVDGQEALGRHFDAGTGNPVMIIASEDDAEEALAAVEQVDGITGASLVTAGPPASAEGGARDNEMPPAEPVVQDNRVLINAVLADPAGSEEAATAVRQVRQLLPEAEPALLVGGTTAVALDTNAAAQRDLVKIIPIVLVVILGILMVLLRSVVAPVLLIGSVVLSYAAAMGVSAVVFNHLFGFPGADASVPLFGFVFLVALGVDYNIFLMTRVREESLSLGTRTGTLRALVKTGGVITSAGVVLAATFAALGVIPILFLAQLAFIVAFGVLLDTIVVRSLLVPALAYDLGAKLWWPSKLGGDTRG